MIDLEGISVRFGGIVALGDVSFQANAGEVLGIIGPNGAGKTTLFDVISGIRTPNEGRVRLDGADITNRSSSWRARAGLRRTFQRVQTFGWLTVEDNILAALEWRGGGGGFLADMTAFPTRRRRERARRARVDEVMERCGLIPVRHELAGSLPIGVARMVEFARAIVDTPKVLLLDEPASGLDETEIERLGTEIRNVRRETDCAVLLVEHNAGFVMEQSERVVVLDLGSVLASGRTRGDPTEPAGARCVPRGGRRGVARGPGTDPTLMGLLHGRVALVTGSTRGIGNAVAHRLAGEGARVIVHGRDERAVAEAAARIDGAIGVTGAMEDPAQVRAMCERALEPAGVVDIVVNNAGASVHQPFLEDRDDDWDRLLAVNLLGPRDVLRHLLPGMRRNGWGRIVNVTSAAGIRGTAGYPAYAAPRARWWRFSLTLALELAGTGVCVNAFAPVALTDMVRSQVTPGTLEYLVDQGLPTVDECAQELLPLVVDDAPDRPGAADAPRPRTDRDRRRSLQPVRTDRPLQRVVRRRALARGASPSIVYRSRNARNDFGFDASKAVEPGITVSDMNIRAIHSLAAVSSRSAATSPRVFAAST